MALLALCSAYFHGHGAAKYTEAANVLAEVSSPIRKKRKNYTSHQSFLPHGMLGLF